MSIQIKRLLLIQFRLGKARKIYHYVGEFHTIKCNRLEAEYLSDCSIESLEDVPKAAQALLDKGLKQVFYYFRERGRLLRIKRKTRFLPAMRKGRECEWSGMLSLRVLSTGMLSQLNIQEMFNLPQVCHPYHLKVCRLLIHRCHLKK